MDGPSEEGGGRTDVVCEVLEGGQVFGEGRVGRAESVKRRKTGSVRAKSFSKGRWYNEEGMITTRHRSSATGGLQSCPCTGCSTCSVSQSSEGFGVGSAGYAAFGEDGGDVFVGSDVEGRMRGVDVWRDADAFDLGYFVGGTLFDGDVIAAGDGKIESGDWRGDVEGHVVFFGEHGDLVGADFVGGIAVGRDAIGSGDDGADFPGFQKVPDHVVGDQGERNVAAMQFPGGEARTLQIRARFGNETWSFLPCSTATE